MLKKLWQNFELNFLASDNDAKQIKTLKRKGLNLDEPKWVDFYFEFASETEAQTMAKALKQIGFGVLVYPDQGSYTCQAKKRLQIELKKIQAMSARFSELAIRMGGNYRGWGCQANQT